MPPPISGTNAERFWRSTAIVGACIERLSWQDKDGYTRFAVRLPSLIPGRKVKSRYLTVIAHRWIYEQVAGVKLPPDRVVMHSCDNPRCVKIQHLSPGTQQANQHDSIKKGRHTHLRGLTTKLSKTDVRKIRVSKEPYRVIMKRYGISHSYVWSIRTGRARAR